MQGVRIQFRYLAYGAAGFLPVLPGEPVFDTSTKRFGIGIGGNQAIWYPKATPEGNLEFDVDQGLVKSDGTMSLKFTTTGLAWKVGSTEVFATRGTSGVTARGAVFMRNAAGADVVQVGYGHWVALMAMLWNIKALLKKIKNNTAVDADVDALFTPPVGLNLTTLDPAFPEAPSL